VSRPVRVRIAPSPTGTVHLGLCRTALFNWAFARGRGGTFVMRIEDTDADRNTQESLDAILEGLRWLGLDWEEGPDVGGPHGPYMQSERIEGHRATAAKLLDLGVAYRDFSTAEELDAWRAEQEARKQKIAYRGKDRDLDAVDSARRAEAGEEFALRFRIPEGETTFTDLVRGQVTVPHFEIDDWVLVRRNAGNPTYNFVVVCDDVDMAVSHVFRGEEHLINTPKQLLLYSALGLEAPEFGHLPLMLGSDRKKLSKRTGDTSLGDYRANGYPQKAILNFLALQGWALDGETEVFSMEQLIKNFEAKDVSKAGAVFDLDKFAWLAGEYLRQESAAELALHTAPYVIEAGLLSADEIADRREWFERIVLSVQERLNLYADLPGWIGHFFAEDNAVEYDAKAEKGARKRDRRVELLEGYAAWLTERGSIGEPAELGEATKAWIQEHEAKIPDLFQPLRCALTGQPGGPDLFQTLDLLGFHASLARIAAGAQRLA
jgi:nondiscriminating glutamyl-tRNA synthetase